MRQAIYVEKKDKQNISMLTETNKHNIKKSKSEKRVSCYLMENKTKQEKKTKSQILALTKLNKTKKLHQPK